MLIIILAIIVAVVLYFVTVYNQFVTLRGRIRASIQEIGNQLKRQVELIPNLEESAKAYLKHEKEIVKMLADARKAVTTAVGSGDLDAMSKAGDQISQALSRLQVVVESNPEIKGAEVVTKLMEELRDTSDKVMYSRRTLIDITADYNIKLQSFPTNLIAQMFGFQPEKGLDSPMSGSHLEVSESDTKTPKVSL